MKQVASLVCIGSILLIAMISGLTVVTGQEATPDPTQIPFPSLDCDDIQSPFSGPDWHDITIGSSTIDDLLDTVNELSADYTVNAYPTLQQTTFSLLRNIAEEENIPMVIGACTEPERQLVIALVIFPPPQPEPLLLTDLVAAHGSPDFVVWGETSRARVAVWLTSGLAASVSVDESEQTLPYGAVTRMVYFPYQELDGYEERWPYTHRAEPRPDFVTSTPYLPYETDPFDFDAMIATITAQPSRTPTPTP